MKAKYILVSLLLVALVMTGTGYSVSAGSGGKATGGGQFINSSYGAPYANPLDKISFGFNVQGQGIDAKGQIHIVNHTLGTKVSGTVSEILSYAGTVHFKGSLTDGTEFEAWITSGSVTIDIGGNTGFKSQYGSFKGNITVHKIK